MLPNCPGLVFGFVFRGQQAFPVNDRTLPRKLVPSSPLADRARLLNDEVENRLAATTNRSLSALTVISTLLLPPTFIVGAFGMNVGAIPWAGSPHGFWTVLGLCVLAIAAGYAVLRRFRILP